MMTLRDPRGRRINYLRLSVTDRCNLRCSYCMPADRHPNEPEFLGDPTLGNPKLFHPEILSYEDLYRIACQAVTLGFEKVRVTGGEPLVRRGIVDFLRKLSAIPGLTELVLTTNGVLLGSMAEELRRAGVRRLNVSLDSLAPETFARITRGGELKRVFEGLEAAAQAGFPPVKLNVVVMRGVNDGEVLDFVRLAAERALTVRFIEYMPVANQGDWQSLWVPGSEILRSIEERYRLESVDVGEHAGPARIFRVAGTEARVGLITPISRHFCSRCNRIRITSTGLAKGCLFTGSGIDIKPYLRAGDDALREALRGIVNRKPARHHMEPAQIAPALFSMAQIGG